MDGIQAGDGSERTSPQTGQEEPGAQEEPVSDAAFDRWLTHHLRRLYDPVANESIPTDLIRALESRLK